MRILLQYTVVQTQELSASRDDDVLGSGRSSGKTPTSNELFSNGAIRGAG
jgi:hypothetical protein